LVPVLQAKFAAAEPRRERVRRVLEGLGEGCLERNGEDGAEESVGANVLVAKWRWVLGSRMVSDMGKGERLGHHRAIGVTRAEPSAGHSVSTERLRAAFEGMAVGMILKGAEGETLESNPALRRMLGYGEEELRGMTRSDYTHPADAGRDAELYRQLLAGARDSFRMEKRYVRKDGSVMWGRLSVSRIEGTEGEPAFAVGVVEDITESREAAQEIERLNRQNRLILDSAGEGIYGLDREGKITFVNPAAATLVGYDPEDLIGKSQHEVVHHSRPDGTPYPREECPIYAALTDGGGQHVGGEVFWRKDGTSFPVEYTSTPIMEGSENAGAVVTFTDVTERLASREALQESEERYRAVVEQSAESIWLFDPATKRVLESNPEFQEMLGYTAEELREMTNYDFVAHAPKDIDAAVERVVQQRRGFFGERKYRRKDGTTLDVEVSGTVIPYKGKEVVCGVARDLTERKKAEEALRESERHFRALTQNSSDVVTLLTSTGTIRYQSPSIERILGYLPEETIGDDAFGYVHPDDLPRVEMAFAKGLKDPGRRPLVEYRFRHKDGSWVWLESVGTNLLGDPGVGQYVINSRNVTKRKRAERALKESEERFRGTFENAPIGMALVGLPSSSPDSDGRYLRVNRALCEMLGYSKEELLSKTSAEVTHPDDRERSRARVERLLEEGGSKYTIEKRYSRSDGRVVWAILNVSLIRDSGGNPSHLISQYQDVTERKEAEERLEHQAFHDYLTGLPNRRLFVDRLGHALKRTKRRRDHRVAVLFMDLDGFKVVNDSLGHEAGDLLLVVVAERLRRCLRPEDTLARFGGDEFAVLLEDVGGPDDPVRVADRINSELGHPFVVEGRKLYARASIGITICEDDSKNPNDLLRDADTAMYEAKSGAASGYRVFAPAMHERVSDRLVLENDLRRAIEREQFRLFYQPKYRLKEEATVAEVEALLRWEHPRRGLLMPDEFIPLAEQTGLIVSIGRWVLKETCRQAKEWQERYPKTPPLVACVNVAAGQLRYPDFLHDVGSALGESGLEARSLALEITESALVKDIKTSMTVLKELRKEGIRFALDDFGSEYSSLSYLMRLPVDFVKVDKSFVWGLGKDPRAEVIVEAIISLAHSLGLEVVGEGVESAEQLESLRSMGCDLVQGYHLAKPLPPEDVPKFLAE